MFSSDWGTEAPYRGMNRDRFKVRWEGHLIPPVDGDYRFSMQVDDFGVLTIDDETVLRAQSKGESSDVTLQGGKPVPITLEFKEDYSKAIMKLFWKVPGGKMEPVPARALLPLTGDRESAVVAKSTATDPRGESRNVKLTVGRRGRT